MIGRRIARLRKQLNITQEDLAASVGISREYLSNIERGHESISIRLLAQIAKALNVEISCLLDG